MWTKDREGWNNAQGEIVWYEDGRGGSITLEGAGADFIGFIFWRRSHRFVEPEQAARIVEAVPHVKKVGVFVDETPEVVNLIAKQCHLDFVQLHGHEVRPMRSRWKSPSSRPTATVTASAEAANAYPAAMILVDAYQEGTAGGTGTRFDWQRAQREVAAVGKPVLIAGGISKANVGEVSAIFHPFAVDVSGSLEVHREKSAERIAAFMAQMGKINGRN